MKSEPKLNTHQQIRMSIRRAPFRGMQQRIARELGIREARVSQMIGEGEYRVMRLVYKYIDECLELKREQDMQQQEEHDRAVANLNSANIIGLIPTSSIAEEKSADSKAQVSVPCMAPEENSS